MRHFLIGASALMIAGSTAFPISAETILFVGNSFTFGANSAAKHWGSDTVTDLNGERIGGVPALFKRFTVEAGLTYEVALETAPGRSLGWHFASRRAVLDRRWDHVVLQEYSTLDPARPGDPTRMTADTAALVRLFALRNPQVAIRMTATWSRPDLVYRPGSRWSGTPIATMADDLRAAYNQAARAAGRPVAIVPAGQAFTCAIRAGIADADPYDGIAYGTLPLWSWDQYHPSAYGYYLAALTVFGSITGRDPRTLGADETAAVELGFSAAETTGLQAAAQRALATDGACGR